MAMASDIGPQRTDKPVETVTLTGKLMPWNGAQPVMLSMTGSPLLYLPVFSTEEKLRAVMAKVGLDFRSIKQIDDGPTFLHGLYADNPGARGIIVVILDPYYLPNGRVRFTQVQLPATD